jgi:hypothetical protein
MATSTKTTKGGKAEQDVIGRLAGKGEETLHRLAELPGGTKALKAFNDLKARVDDLSKKVRGVEALEARIVKLEKEVAALKRAQKPTSRRGGQASA